MKSQVPCSPIVIGATVGRDHMTFLFLSSSNIRKPSGKMDFPYIDYISFSSPANAITCPDLATDMTGFLLQEKNMYEKTLEKYNAPPEFIEAKMQVKACTDEMSLMSRMLIEKALVIPFFFVYRGFCSAKQPGRK